MRRERYDEIKAKLEGIKNHDQGSPVRGVTYVEWHLAEECFAEVPEPEADREVIVEIGEIRLVRIGNDCHFQYLSHGAWFRCSSNHSEYAEMSVNEILRLRADLAKAKANLESFMSARPPGSPEEVNDYYAAYKSQKDKLREGVGLTPLAVALRDENEVLRADLALMEDALKGRVVVDGVEWKYANKAWVSERDAPSMQVDLCSGGWRWYRFMHVRMAVEGTAPTLFAAMRAAKAGEAK
jgi:hypothetical protein